MKYKLIIFLLLTASCATNFDYSQKKPFNSKGFAYIYSDNDSSNKIITQKMNNDLFQIAHNKLRRGTLIKLINPINNKSVILLNTKKIGYPDFYKVLITKPVAEELKLDKNLPFIEVLEVKKNKSFVAEKTKIYSEEKKIHSNAPVELVKVQNISKNKKNNKKIIKEKIFIIIAEFYSKNSASLLKERIDMELKSFDSTKLKIKAEKANKITLLSGPYTSINLMKNDYIQLKNFGFEELDITINE